MVPSSGIIPPGILCSTSKSAVKYDVLTATKLVRDNSNLPMALSIRPRPTKSSMSHFPSSASRPYVSKGPLPKGYEAVAKRVTLVLAAMPIAIVTSWALYDRRRFLPLG